MNNFKLITLFFILSLSIAFGQSIDLKEIMKGDEFIGHQPDNVHWTNDGRSILFEWNPENNPDYSEYEYSLNSGKVSLTTPNFHSKHTTFDPDQAGLDTIYFTDKGSLFYYSSLSKSVFPLIQTSNFISEVHRVKNPSIIYIVIDKNFYKYATRDGSLIQLTDYRKGSEKKEEQKEGFLIDQQKELFEFIQEENEAKAWRNDQPKLFESLLKKSYYYGDGSLQNLQISPNEKFVSFRLQTYPSVSSTHVEHHISSDGLTYTESARSKVSDQDPSNQLYIHNLVNDSVYQVDFSSLPEIRKKPKYLNDNTPYFKDRNIIMHNLKFHPSKNHALLDVRSYDNKDRWIVLLNLENGNFEIIDHQHDDAWIGGPGISSWNMVEGTLDWLNETTCYFQSEDTGYSHLYTYDIEKHTKTALTSGDWEVREVQLARDKSKFYITANKSHPGNRSFYHLHIASKNLIPILEDAGAYEVSISPDENYLAVRYSYKNKPWELYSGQNKQGVKLKQITHSTTKQFEAINWIDPEVITIKASDDVPVYARLYKPDTAMKNGAAVIFVHGAGYLQNAHNFWSGYHREYMFHNLLVSKGFTVLDIDYRASDGYGRDYRTAIYRHMGGRDLQDQIDGKNYLVNELGIDANRVGIYGGSYGGFITLMALLTTPDEFACGAALRSVTDWAHYNHEYTSNILNYPGTDPEAYRKSSPIYFADQLNKPLVMLHGMVDDNVQFQDVVRLSQRFIELQKTDWELAVYPVEAHGFVKDYSWHDEYRRILELFEQHLVK